MKFTVIAGQILGIVAVILGFINYQVKKPKTMLFVQLATCVVFCAHYLLIDATSAFALNAVGVVRNIVYSNRDKKIFSSGMYPIIFTVIMGIMGIISWQGIYSVFVVMGLVINTYCISIDNAQTIRKSILVSSTLVLIYDAFVCSIGGVIYEAVAIISAIIGIVKERKSKEM